jgi:hypothetical protein
MPNIRLAPSGVYSIRYQLDGQGPLPNGGAE